VSDDELIRLIDRLEELLNASQLTEIEVEAGDTALVLRKPGALAAATASVATPTAQSVVPAEAPLAAAADGPSPNAVLAPLTGLFYGAPSPDATPYVRVGAEVVVGQVIGLIEAMKLFNEIKSDRAGKVSRIYVEDGALVKAKQPLIEVE
jgi:acetyl-CoA carboxylase biotin carboxyl carrier protein